ncbi:MAG: TIGR02147 family protein [Bdellovibrionales bacterium]
MKTEAALQQPKDFRLLLQKELVQRCKRNPRYSLRTFATFLDIEPSRLSKVLRGQRPISNELLQRLAEKLKLNPSEIESYKIRSSGSNKSDVEEADYQQISLDTFEIIADWKHYAILELMKLKSFKPEIPWIAKKLNLSVLEITAFIERLERVGILEISEKDVWTDLSNGFTSHILGPNYTTYGHRKSQEEILNMAVHALHNVAFEYRDQTSMMMATSYKKIEKAKKMITKFRRELTAFLEDTDEKDSIYQLGISLFPLTQLENLKNK